MVKDSVDFDVQWNFHSVVRETKYSANVRV